MQQQVLHGSPDRDPANNIGPTLGFQFRTPRNGPAAYVFELMAQPVPAWDRHALFEDPFAPFYLAGGVEIGRKKYIRVSAGFTTVGSVAPIAGLALGLENGGRLLTGAEFVVRMGGRPHAYGVLAGLQLRLGVNAR